MKVTIRLLNVKEEQVALAEIESKVLGNINNIIYKDNHYAYSAISHRTNVVTYRQVCKPVQLDALPVEIIEVHL